MKHVPPHIKEKIDKLTGELKAVYELAEESWEGCDGCDENDKNFFMKGFQAGYNTAKPDEISAELRYKDGTPIRKHNSPKLQAIEMEISDEDIREGAEKWVFETNGHKWSNNNDEAGDNYGSFMEGVKWYREQLKNKKD